MTHRMTAPGASWSEFAGNDARVVLIGRDTNGGPGVARNCGLMAARGDWVALLDADDLYETDHLETLLKAARAHQCDVVAGNVLLIRSYPQEDAVEACFSGSDRNAGIAARSSWSEAACRLINRCWYGC